MDTEKGVTLDNLKEQLGSKFQLMKKNDTRSRIQETILSTGMAVKQKRVYKTTRKNKEDKEIPYCHYCDKKYHREDRCWKKLQDLSLKDQNTKTSSRIKLQIKKIQNLYVQQMQETKINGSSIQEHLNMSLIITRYSTIKLTSTK